MNTVTTRIDNHFLIIYYYFINNTLFLNTILTVKNLTNFKSQL